MSASGTKRTPRWPWPRSASDPKRTLAHSWSRLLFGGRPASVRAEPRSVSATSWTPSLDQEVLSTEEVMSRNFASVIGYAAVLVLFTASPVLAAQFGTAEEAKAMLERAVAAV